MQQIYRRIPMPKCDFSKVVLQLNWNHTSTWVFSCDLLHIFRTPFSKNISGGLLLCLACWWKLISSLFAITILTFPIEHEGFWQMFLIEPLWWGELHLGNMHKCTDRSNRKQLQLSFSWVTSNKYLKAKINSLCSNGRSRNVS